MPQYSTRLPVGLKTPNTIWTGPDALMVFDGVCNFCSGYVRLVSTLDTAGTIYFTPVQSPYGKMLCESYGIDSTDPSTFLFIENGEAQEATNAMAAMFARLPYPWRALRYLTVIPKTIRDAIYRWTARNRYKLLGKRRECMIPSQKIRDRFIDSLPREK